MLRILAIALFALAGVSAAHADVYRWVDSNGVVQYSDRWVPGSVLVKQDKNRPAASAAPAPTATASPASPAATPGAAPVSRADEILTRERDRRAVDADVAKTREAQCKKAREAYDMAVSRTRLYRTGKDGEKVFLSDEEINQRRVELLNQRRELCGS